MPGGGDGGRRIASVTGRLEKMMSDLGRACHGSLAARDRLPDRLVKSRSIGEGNVFIEDVAEESMTEAVPGERSAALL
ncbi:MAG: hypothetical protein ACREI7_12695, partial [Myxococcota bacterium]